MARRKRTPRWLAITSTTIEERIIGGVTKLPADYKPRQIVVTQLLDDLGRRWIDHGDGPVLIPDVPDVTREE